MLPMVLPKIEQVIALHEGVQRIHKKYNLEEAKFNHPYEINVKPEVVDPVCLALTTAGVHPTFNYERLEFLGFELCIFP